MKQATDFRDESDALYRVLASLSPADYQRPTQFKGWTLNDIVTHLHVWNQAADYALNEPDAFQRFLAKAGPAMMSGDMRAVEHEQQGGHAGSELVEIWRAFYLAMAARFADADPKTRIQWAGPSMSVRSAMTARQMETWAHGQAIFDALGIERTDTDRIGNIAVLGVKTFEFNFANRRQTPPGPAPHVRLTAPSGDIWEWNEDNPSDRIAGTATEFCQVVTEVRNVADTQLEVTGEVARAWMAIAQCFAGPPHDPPPAGTRFRVSNEPSPGASRD